jgi:hypothetical protein
MKKNSLMMLALVAMTAGVAVNAENTTCAAATTEAVSTQLSADELAFAAKLNDQNRKSFNDKFSVEQRKAIMVAAKNGANADEAVQKMLAAKEIKNAPAVAEAEKATAETVAPAATATK